MTVEVEYHIELDEGKDSFDENRWVLSLSRERAEKLWTELGDALGYLNLDDDEPGELAERVTEHDTAIYRVMPDGSLGERIDTPTPVPETEALTSLTGQQLTPEEVEAKLAAQQATGHIPHPRPGTEIGNLPR